MDYFLAICQALGIGLAIGAVVGAAGPEGNMATVLALVVAAAAGAAGALSMSTDDQSVVGGIAAAAVAGYLAAMVLSGVVAGAGRRSEGGIGTIGFIVALGAGVLAVLSVLVPPISLLALAGLGWLALARRRRSQRKYEGLRILR